MRFEIVLASDEILTEPYISAIAKWPYEQISVAQIQDSIILISGETDSFAGILDSITKRVSELDVFNRMSILVLNDEPKVLH